MMLSAGRCQFIARDKSGGCFFSLSLPLPLPLQRLVSGSHRQTRRVNEPRFSRQRGASRHYIFSTLLQRPPQARTYRSSRLFITVQSKSPRPAIRASLAALLCETADHRRLDAALHPSSSPSFPSSDPCHRIFSLSLFFINISPLCTFLSLLFGINYKVFRDPFRVIYARKASYRVPRLQNFLKKAGEIRAARFMENSMLKNIYMINIILNGFQ